LIHPLANGLVKQANITTLNQLVSRTEKAPRAPRTVFKSIGVALADLAAAEQLWERHAPGGSTEAP
jgi:ornithine cyclodeaminase/alanine dehydrogenase-like protein (mu-crystallin family)